MALASVLRLIPHPFGITPFCATGLFAGTQLNKWKAPLYMMLGLAIGDAIIGFYDFRVLGFVYIGFLLCPIIGRLLLSADATNTRLAGVVVINATVFFIVSNIGNWWAFHPHTLEGLVTNYINGLPYYAAAIIGDLFYSLLIFRGFQLLSPLAAAKQKTVSS